MRRLWIRRLTLPLWVVWLAFAVTERPLSFDCPMRAPAGDAAHAAVPMAGMHHAAEPKADLPANANCCGCLADCGSAPGVPMPAPGEVVALAIGTPVRRAPGRTVETLPLVRVDLALPLANAPPRSALI